jgi:copper homeostasis protein (lipoprotein)
MNIKKSLVILLLAALVISGLVSCVSSREIDNAHNSRNSLDWAGVYTGTTPSASGSGINVRLRLNQDERFVLWYEYVDKPDSQYSWTGPFTWDKKGEIIYLQIKEWPSYYKVEENRLIQLDMKGKLITGDLADNYVLTKER